MAISLPTYKLHSIQKEVSHFLSLERVPFRDLACLIGTLVATKPAVWTGPLHYRALQDLKIQALCQNPSYQRSVSLSEEALADLPSHCSAPMLKPDASIVRCFQVRLGYSLSRGSNRWQVDSRGGWTPHQHFEAQGNVSDLAVISEGQVQCGSIDQVRKSHCHSLPEQNGQPHTISAFFVC